MNIFPVERFRVIMAPLFVLCCIDSSAISFSFLQIWLVFFSYSQLFSFSLFIVKFLVVEVRCFHVHYHVLHKPLEFCCFMELFAFLITEILYFYTFPDYSIPSRQYIVTKQCQFTLLMCHPPVSKILIILTIPLLILYIFHTLDGHCNAF